MSNWISENRSLSQSERENNARIVWDIFGTWGWSLNAVCGMLGNMEVESGISPAVVQNFATNNPPKLGYGLIQWTSNVNNVHDNTLWAWIYRNYHDYNWQDGDRQCIFINGEDGQYYYPTKNYPLTYAQFKVSTETPEYLAATYHYNRERGTWTNLRPQYARKWYEFFRRGR